MADRRTGRADTGRTTGTLMVAMLVVVSTTLIHGCLALGVGLAGVIFTSRTCDYPGACGQKGRLLFSFRHGVSELLPGSSANNIGFANPYPAEITGGLAFANTPRGLRLYYATTDGLMDDSGSVAYTNGHLISVPNCALMGDVVVLEGGDVVVSCYDSNRLVRIVPGTRTVVSSFSCCEGIEGSFLPYALALRDDGVILAGTREINQFESATGEFLGLAVESGVMGAGRYDDFLFGPNGNLFVSANPDAGILEFDGVTYEFVRVFVPAGTGGMAAPGALAFNAEGELFVNGYEGLQLLRFDGETGALLEEVIPDEPGDRILFMAFRP